VDCELSTGNQEEREGGRRSGGCQENGDGLGDGGCNGFVAREPGAREIKVGTGSLTAEKKKKETTPDGVTHVLSP